MLTVTVMVHTARTRPFSILNISRIHMIGSCSGTAAGSQFGVAKSANLIAVKVLSDAG